MQNSTASPPPPARLIVCERSGRWAVALRRELAGSGVRVWETRTLDDCWSLLGESPASFAVVELGRNTSDLLRRIGNLRREFPKARLAVAADRCKADYQWLLREAGASHFLCSTRQTPRLAQLICRHLAEAPMPQQNLGERIWSGLPWG